MHTKLSENLVEESALESYQFPHVDFDGLRQKPYWPTFELGEIWVSPLVAKELTVADLEQSLHQHGLGSWGMLGPSDWRANDFCLDAGRPVLSIYKAENGAIFMVHTDFDRQLTEILLPREL
jgi:hypothetical protein